MSNDDMYAMHLAVVLKPPFSNNTCSLLSTSHSHRHFRREVLKSFGYADCGHGKSRASQYVGRTILDDGDCLRWRWEALDRAEDEVVHRLQSRQYQQLSEHPSSCEYV